MAATSAEFIRVLDALFERSKGGNNLAHLFAAVIDKLSRSDPATAMVVIRTLLDEALAALPQDEQDELLREFTKLASRN